jgi:hypothetical protein
VREVIQWLHLDAVDLVVFVAIHRVPAGPIDPRGTRGRMPVLTEPCSDCCVLLDLFKNRFDAA